jgi:hypothetical protein
MTFTAIRPVRAIPPGIPPEPLPADELAAHLTEAAYGVALRHGIKGSFLEFELALWKALRAVVANGAGGERRSCA